ncbi:S-layer protein [Levilactobacillus lindianensis]|uniref:S-layer protein n=1 Tax=Levilactobacillus lindianensis TaxID=2486018 RepID=UPI000F73AA01|nr:S-layer protein [Levilactobacillus lindianensis]
MRSILAKSLYVGLAALSLGGVANSVIAPATANAASKAKIVSKVSLGKDGQNVQLTGKNAIYTKPGTVNGAKRVVSKAKAKNLAASKHSADYFRAYHMALTNRGTVYYKVVSMNGKYRGYIYGGRVQKAFTGGVQEATTTHKATMPTRTTGFHLRNVNKNTLWTAPKNTEYKAHRVSLYGLNKNDTFKVSKAVTKSKEGTLYYYVTAESDSSISGWIYAGEGYKDATTTEFGGLTVNVADQAATNDNSVTIQYRDAKTKAEVAKATWTTADKKTVAGQAVNDAKNASGQTLTDVLKGKLPSGYRVQSDTTIADAVKGASYGNTVYVDITAAATSKISMAVGNVMNTVSAASSDGKAPKADATTAVDVINPLKKGAKLTAKDVQMALSADAIKALTGEPTATVSSKLGVIAGGFTTGAKGLQTYKDKAGVEYHYEFSIDTTSFTGDNWNKHFGDDLKATFTAQLVLGKGAGTTTGDNSWQA